MRPVSERFLRAVRGSHQMAARARVVAPGQTGTDPDGTEVPIFGGSVRLDSAADVRSLLDLTTDGARRFPSRSNRLLAPYSPEIFVERGVVFGGGSTEWVSLGYHRIDTPTQKTVPDGAILLACSDRMANIVDADLTAPRQYQSAQTFGAVVDDLVLDVLPSALVEWDDSTSAQAIGRDLLVERKRYEALRDLVTSVGKVAYFDHRGILVIKSPPDPGSPTYDVTHGKNGVLVEMSRELTRVGVHNGWVVTGESADSTSPVRAVVVDNNPDSPTYWYGDFGKVPGFFTSPVATNEATALDAAASLLRQSIGLPYRVDFGLIPNPALEPLDPIRVSYSDKDGREKHVIETLVIPLTADVAMAGRTREQTVVIIGGAT